MNETLIVPLASNSVFPNACLPEIYDPEALAAHDPRWWSERFARRPIGDELLYIQALMMAGVAGLRVRNNTGTPMVAGTLVYISAFAGIIEEGDTANQMSAWVLTGVTLRNTGIGRLWWTLTNVTTTRTVKLYRHKNADGTFPAEALVASGSRSGNGSVTLTQENTSGIAGSVLVAYTVDDTDGANVIYLDVHDISLADATLATHLAQYALTATIAAGAHGTAYYRTEVTGIDTSGAAAAGSSAYTLDTPGTFGWTQGTVNQRCGICTYKDATNGRILFILPGWPGTGDLWAHGSTHSAGSTDPVKLDDLAAPDDNTDLNASITKHGLCPKCPNVATQFLDGTGAFDTVKDSDLETTDITTGDVGITKHGFAPKSPNDDTKFLDGQGAYDTVKDSDLATTDITTGDASTTKHGFLPKLPNSIYKILNGAGTWEGVRLSPICFPGICMNYNAVVGTWTICFCWTNGTAANSDSISFNILVPAGTYSLVVSYFKGTTEGKFDTYVDAANQGNTDAYSASATAMSFVTFAGIALTGSHTIKFLMNGKNASSNAYALLLYGFSLIRTG